jgi:hypothetical protein
MYIDQTFQRRVYKGALSQRRLAVSSCSEIAVSQPDPARWVEELWSNVHRRLDATDADSPVKEAARKHLQMIRDDLRREIAARGSAA